MHVLISALSRFTSPTGICRHSANLCRALADRPEIDRITFVAGSWQGYYRDLWGTPEPQKMDLVQVELRNDSISRNRWFVSGLPAIARSRNADIVHLSFPLPFRRTDSARTVVTLHDLYPYDCPQVFGRQVFFNRLFLRSCLNKVDGIASVSHATQARLRALFPAQVTRKSRVIPNIVSLNGTTSAAPLTPWPERPFVLVVAQHRRNKNLGLAAQGFAQLRNRGVVPSETRLVIVGSPGPETDSLRSTIRSTGIESDTVLLSQVPEAQLQWLYQNSLLLLITSTIEGFCLPLVEGLRFSSRPVCSDIPILREVGGKQCQYFSIVDSPIDSLVAAARRALSLPRPEAPDLERFSPKRAGAAYVKFYSDLLNVVHVSETTGGTRHISSVISKS